MTYSLAPKILPLLKNLSFHHWTQPEGRKVVRRIATLTTASAPEITSPTLARGHFNRGSPSSLMHTISLILTELVLSTHKIGRIV